MKNKLDVHFSSATDMWSTPSVFFNKVTERFGEFDLDVCATIDNTKAKKYFTEQQNGLIQEWEGLCWMNPPYGREIGKWMKKAHDSALSGKATVVCLVPSRTDTAWWHDYAIKGNVEFIRGRLKFGDAKNSAPFPSALVIFDKNKL
jgi:phage N-6-adenine-methyltransferase